MAVLSKQFKDALSTIEPGDDADHARDAHAKVRDVLASDEDLAGWGLKSLLIGSYAREVSIRRVKDVDVFCELYDLPHDYDPQDLLNKVATVLAEHYGDRVTKNDRSVKVEFPDFDMHVDVVPARPAGDAWEIPDKDGGWEPTDPIAFGTLSSARNTDFGGNYVPTVTLVRQTRRALLGDTKPGGLFVEVAAYHAFDNIPLDDADDPLTSTAAYYTRALTEMAPRIRGHADGSAPLSNPALPDQDISVRATEAEMDAIAEAWEEAANVASEALTIVDNHDAATKYSSLLGENSDGEQVFAIPAKASTESANLSPGYTTLPSGSSPTFG
jgi:hypothetical protein